MLAVSQAGNRAGQSGIAFVKTCRRVAGVCVTVSLARPRHLPQLLHCNYSRLDQAAKSPVLAMSYTGFWNEIRKIPPVTRFLCGSSLAVTLPVMLQLLGPYKVIFVRGLVTHQFEVCLYAQNECLHSNEAQLWRIWSSFFFGGMWSPVVSRCTLDMLKLDCRQRYQLHFRAGHDVVCALVFLPFCSLKDGPFQSLFEHP